MQDATKPSPTFFEIAVNQTLTALQQQLIIKIANK